MGSFAGYKFVGVNSYSKDTGWAMLLAEYITNEQSQKAIGVATGEGPSNINAAASDEVKKAAEMGTDPEWSDFPYNYRFRGYCVPYRKRTCAF